VELDLIDDVSALIVLFDCLNIVMVLCCLVLSGSEVIVEAVVRLSESMKMVWISLVMRF